MQPSDIITDKHYATWDAYRANLPRHLTGISRYLQSQTMHSLRKHYGHKGLRLSFEPYITLVGHEGCSISELAAKLKISKQACSQTASQVEQAGYLKKITAPLDRRTKILSLTDLGKKLSDNGAHSMVNVQAQFSQLVGARSLRGMMQALDKLSVGLQLPQPRIAPSKESQQILLAAQLPRINEFVSRRLMSLTINKGHPGLKMSHGQVLSLIGLSGGRIQQMASIQEVSKQAISAIAKDLEKLGYIHRISQGGGSVMLKLTPTGLDLLTDSVASVDEVETEITKVLSLKQLEKLKKIVYKIYSGLHLEEEIFESINIQALSADSTDVRLLADRLVAQLGKNNARKLAKLIMTKNL
jgi:DNA-binding MarR family transcriptional regulator